MPRGGYREKAGRKSGWNNLETQVIRVPKILAERLLDIARHLDKGEEVSLLTPSKPVVEILDPVLDSLPQIEVPGQMSIFDSVTESKESSESEFHPIRPMGLRELAKRLGKSSGTLSRYKDSPDELLTWTYLEDKECGWQYDETTKLFHPVHPSKFTNHQKTMIIMRTSKQSQPRSPRRGRSEAERVDGRVNC
jgi:hypothetical protein